MAFKIFNIGKANQEIDAAAAALAPALAKAGITTITENGKAVPAGEASLAAQISALLAVNPPGAGSQQISDVLISNDLLSKELEKTKVELATAQASVAALTREKVELEGKLATAQASVTTLTAEKADLNVRLSAAVNEFTAQNTKILSYNTELSKLCIAAGCLELTNQDGTPLATDATPDQKIAAADRVPIADKLKAYQGAVNSALARTGVDAGSLPGPAGKNISITHQAVLNKYNAIKDPTEKVTYYRANKAAIDAAFSEMNRSGN